jgi:hypothetical protein
MNICVVETIKALDVVVPLTDPFFYSLWLCAISTAGCLTGVYFKRCVNLASVAKVIIFLSSTSASPPSVVYPQHQTVQHIIRRSLTVTNIVCTS